MRGILRIFWQTSDAAIALVRRGVGDGVQRPAPRKGIVRFARETCREELTGVMTILATQPPVPRAGHRRTLAAIASAAALAPTLAMAADNFSVTVTSNGVTTTASAGTLEDFVDLGLSSTSYEDLNPAYTDTSPATGDLNYRGLPITVAFPSAGPELVFSVPELGITETFAAQSTRDGNGEDLEDFLRNDEDGVLSQILNYFVENTGTDPVAGNPASLQGNMVASDFGVGTGLGSGNGSRADRADAGGGDGRRNVYGAAARFGRFSVDGNDIDSITLPLSFVRPLEDPRYAVIIDLPLTYVETNGAASVAGSLGLGMRVPITTRWTLTPLLRAGATGSIDLGSVAALYSGSLSSSYRFDVGSTEVNIGNMLSYITTQSLSRAVDDFDVDYDLENTVTRNGVGLSGPLGYDLFGIATTWQASVVNTQIFGDAVYIDNYTDFAVSFGTEASRNGLTWDAIRIGLTYTVGNQGYQGGQVNFGYQF